MVRIPSYRRHKPTGQARVTLGGKDFYLGRHGTKESKEAYQRLIGEYIASHGRPPAGDDISLHEWIVVKDGADRATPLPPTQHAN